MSKTLKKILCMVLAVACLASCTMLMSGCGKETPAASGNEPAADPGAADANGDKVLKVAACIPLTGDSAKAGQEFKDSCTLALEAVDYKAGGYTLDVQFVDVTIDPEKGSLALEQAIVKDGIEVIILNWNSSVAVALMDVAAKYQIPYYFGLGASDVITEKYASDPEKYSYYIGKIWPSTVSLITAYYYFVAEQVESGNFAPRNNKIATYCDDTDFGRMVGDTLKNIFSENGWEVVYQDYCATNVTDMYAPISKMKELDASVIVGSFTNPASNAAYLKQAQELDVNALLFCDCFTEDGDWYGKAGEASNYALDSRPKLSSPAAVAFKEAFMAKYNYEPSAAAGGQVWDATNYFLACVAECEKVYGEANSENLYKFGNEYVMKGQFPFNDAILQDCITYDIDSGSIDPVVGVGYFIYPMLQLIDGEMIAVWPESMKEADAIIPDYAK